MTNFVFYKSHCDTSIYGAPELAYEEGSTREDAIVRFTRKHRLTVDSVEEKEVWFLFPDRAAVRYSVEERARRSEMQSHRGMI